MKTNMCPPLPASVAVGCRCFMPDFASSLDTKEGATVLMGTRIKMLVVNLLILSLAGAQALPQQ